MSTQESTVKSLIDVHIKDKTRHSYYLGICAFTSYIIENSSEKINDTFRQQFQDAKEKSQKCLNKIIYQCLEDEKCPIILLMLHM